MRTVVVNIVGGQGAGKTNTMLSLAGWLKWREVETEISPEFAKECIWENRSETFKDEVYITAKQNHRLDRLIDKVRVVVTDRPLIMSIPYMDKYGSYSDSFKDNYYNMVRELNNCYENIYVYLNRVRPYNPNGRNETEEQAKAFDREFRDLLEREEITYTEFDGCEESVPLIGQMVLDYISK